MALVAQYRQDKEALAADIEALADELQDAAFRESAPDDLNELVRLFETVARHKTHS